MFFEHTAWNIYTQFSCALLWCDYIIMGIVSSWRIHVFIPTLQGYIQGYAINLHLEVVIRYKHFSRYWPFVCVIHRWRSPVHSPYKGQRQGALMFTLMRTWANCWTNNGGASDWDDVMSMWRHCSMNINCCSVPESLTWFFLLTWQCLTSVNVGCRCACDYLTTIFFIQINRLKYVYVYRYLKHYPINNQHLLCVHLQYHINTVYVNTPNLMAVFQNRFH